MVRLAGLSTADLAVEVTFTRALAVDDVPVEQNSFSGQMAIRPMAGSVS